jgi:2'-hydroxyisoflavone reductase
MRILILGGTVFLGPHLIDAALARGHELTIFHRRETASDWYPEVEKLRGDRRDNLTALHGGRWDAVIDTCGYLPGIVTASTELLSDAAEHYTFISSISVYESFDLAGTDESSSLKTVTTEEVSDAEKIDTGERATAVSYGKLYGGLKALCEQAAEVAMPGRVLNVRPGLLVGPLDYSDRFTYWVERVAQGGEVLAPGRPDRRVRVLDGRDLGAWIIRMVEAKRAGTYNATGAEDGLTMGQLLDEIARTTRPDVARASRPDVAGASRPCSATPNNQPTFTWAPDEFLLEQKVSAWSELPLWIPEDYNGIFLVSNDKAIAAGLKFRPLSETIRDTLAWNNSRGSNIEWRAGLTPGRERELLKNLPG